MNISFNWIDELVGLSGELRDPHALAERLTMTAAAVEKVETIGAGLDGIVVSRVLEARPHPNADRLTLCRVDRGADEVLDVVCGAPVVIAGALYPHVAPGGELPGGFRIESRKIRGASSHGMLCSEAELELGRDKGGIMRLADGLEPGTPLAEALGLPDTRLTLDLNPNRVDLACHLGVAREVGGPPVLRGFGGPEWSPEWRNGEREASGSGVTIRIEDLDRCTRYMAAVIRGVRVGPSPAWLAGRLLAVGARPISNVVDATNYVLLEHNQPLHAFDLARLAGPEIRVRAAVAGEPLTTLDGQEHELARDQTVIADRDRAIAFAGVMGGLDTEVTGDTVDLLIECAAFDPAGVRGTRAPAGLSTDASYRFERGIDAYAQERALTRCVELILATAGGEADPVGIRVGPEPSPMPPIGLRVDRVNQVLGFGLGESEVLAALEPIGFGGLPAAGDDGAAGRAGRLRISVPGWRTDVTREIDLVEEVARRVGYDAGAGQDRRFRPSAVPADPRVERAARVREMLTARGLLEARSLSFMPEDFRGNRAAVAVPNPLSAEESCLRSAMVPVLLRRLEHNYARGNRNVRLFELGTVFGYATGSGPAEDEDGTGRFEESERVGAIITGARRPDHWSGPGLDFDLWDLKEIAESFAHRLCGAALGPLDGADGADAPDAGRLAGPWLSRGGFQVVKDGHVVGVAGTVDPASVDAPPWAAPAFGLEIDLAAVEGRTAAAWRRTSPFPAVRRDLSMTVPRGVPASDIERAVREATSELLREVRLFDVYSGDEIEGGRLGLAWTFRFRAPDRTLTDRDVESEMSALSDALEKRFDARIRRS